jgi:hypothetical protein
MICSPLLLLGLLALAVALPSPVYHCGFGTLVITYPQWNGGKRISTVCVFFSSLCLCLAVFFCSSRSDPWTLLSLSFRLLSHVPLCLLVPCFSGP